MNKNLNTSSSESSNNEMIIADVSDVPLISVIVPIYNVEKYVRKCLDSLLHQTMKRIEVICIDDGSTDESGKIADEYCNTDEDGRGESYPVIRIIHTENRGLSAARNRGIDEARAEWLMFVDSDDWVDESFCEIPWKAAVENKADLVAFQSYRVVHGRVRKPKDTMRPVGVIDEMTAHENAGVVAWNKLYKKTLFASIRFPNGRVFEEYATTHKLVHTAEKTFLLKDELYFYRVRKGSITHTHTKVNKRDRFVAGLEREKDLVLYGYSDEKAIPYGAAIGFLSVNAPCDDLLYKKAEEIVNSVKGYPKGMTRKQKMGLMVWRINRSLFYLMCKGIGRA